SLFPYTTLFRSDDDGFGRHLEELHGTGDRSAGEVHVGEGLGEHHPLAVEAALHDLGPALVRLEPATDAVGQSVGDQESDVVPVAGVARPGVAESGDENRLCWTAHGKKSPGLTNAVRCPARPGGATRARRTGIRTRWTPRLPPRRLPRHRSPRPSQRRPR